MNGPHHPHWPALADYVVKKQQETGVPGVAVGVLHQGEVAAAGFGITNVEHPLPVTDTTLFQIGSITKTFTGTLTMRLVEEGKLALDTPVRYYVPDFRVVDETASAQVTVRHLLTHLGGWEGDLFLNTGSGDDALAKLIVAMAAQPQLVPLGAHWSYNNSGFGLLGYLIEQVTSISYEAALHAWVLEPLGMENAFLEPSDVLTHRFVVGHAVTSGGPIVLRPWHLARAARPEGGLICHVHDLLRFARFHLGDTTVAKSPVLRADGVAQMQTPQVTVWGDEQWGLSWELNKVDGVQTVSHGGGTHGQLTRLTLVPERQFAVVVLTNAQQGDVITRAVTQWALDAYLELKVSEPVSWEATAEDLVQYSGRYANAFTEAELGVLAGRLIGQVIYKSGYPDRDGPPLPPPAPVVLGQVEPDRLMVLDGAAKGVTVDVIRAADGTIGWIRSGGRLHRRIG